jgi:DNA-binding transcriptional MocR family regulator
MIIEDDPYWYMQFPSAVASEATARNRSYTPTPMHTLSPAKKSAGFPFLDSLIPSYLSVDTEGRVIRLDTFSKTIAPGCRLGWITAQPAIVERILRVTESLTQQPSGFVQSIVAELIMGPQSKHDGGRGGSKDGQGWKVDGWVRWLEGLRGMYERRMNRMCQILEEGRFGLMQQTPINAGESDWAFVSKLQHYEFWWPRAGMFVWVEMHYETHPLWWKIEGPKMAKALWIYLTRKPYLVLACPGEIFSPTEEIAETKGWKYMRLCFAAVSEEEVSDCSSRFVQGIESFWKVKSKKELEKIESSVNVSGLGRGLVDLGLNWEC